jgi:Pyrimidine dimer DNA glycosylase/Protein of unknown function (DUF1722)
VRVWDISPGYLNRQSLLGEHRELHGLHVIHLQGKTGYSRHPETVRWVGCLSGLARRHAYLAAEMRLRGYVDRTPIQDDVRRVHWPTVFVTPPSEQYALLRSKYRDRQPGRIPLPRNAQELWAHHKYSVMARDPATYRTIGRRVARMPRGASLSCVAEELVFILREDPPHGRLVNALEHLWGHVSKIATRDERKDAQRSAAAMLLETRELAVRTNDRHLMASTALSELAAFLTAA